MSDKMVEFAKALEETEDVCSWMRDINNAWRAWLLKCEEEGFKFHRIPTDKRNNILKPIFEDLNLNLEEYDLGDISLHSVIATSIKEEMLVFRFKSEDGYFINIFFENGTLLCNNEWVVTFSPSKYSAEKMWVYSEN